MGDLAFAKSFDMLKNGQKHWAIKILNNGQRYIGKFAGLPWLFIILSQIPMATKAFKKFIQFCDDMMDERMNMKVDRPDISSWILQSPPMSDSSYSQRAWLTGDSRLIIVAGSDTTAATLTHLFYHLAKDPHHIRILRDEIETLRGDLRAPTLLTLKHLNGAINEALRLHPPVPGGVARLTPPQGITVNGTYIPGKVNILAPSYTLFRCMLLSSVT
jgi:cytochrome P450